MRSSLQREHNQQDAASACAAIRRGGGMRACYVRLYPPNARWHGYLWPKARLELELAGNVVRWSGDCWVLNPSGQQRLGGVA